MVADAISLLVGSRKGPKERARVDLEIPKASFDNYNVTVYRALAVYQLLLQAVC